MAPERSTEPPADLRMLRQRMLRISCASGEGHLPSSFSVTEILWALYSGAMRIDPTNLDDPDRDRLILSKGHAALALYVVLAEKGFIPGDWLDSFCDDKAPLLGHPEITIPGVEASTGSLGQGATFSVGLAYALRLRGSPARVYCIVGDQEMNEGCCYEAMLLAAQHKLGNLTWIVDENHSDERSLSVDSIGAKFLAFNWRVDTCSGHAVKQLRDALSDHRVNRPTCLIAHTVKGFGVKTFEDAPNEWHHRPVPVGRLAEFIGAVQ